MIQTCIIKMISTDIIKYDLSKMVSTDIIKYDSDRYYQKMNQIGIIKN
jgi:hypothetical protein